LDDIQSLIRDNDEFSIERLMVYTPHKENIAKTEILLNVKIKEG